MQYIGFDLRETQSAELAKNGIFGCFNRPLDSGIHRLLDQTSGVGVRKTEGEQVRLVQGTIDIQNRDLVCPLPPLHWRSR